MNKVPPIVISLSRILLLLSMFFVACLFGLFMSISMRGKLYEGELYALSDIKADDKLSTVYQSLPKDAKNIDYVVKPFGGVVLSDFDISQSGFEAWTSMNGWAVTEIESPRYVEPLRSNGLRPIEKGYELTQKEYHEGNLRSTLEIIYDAKESRCYYRRIGN